MALVNRKKSKMAAKITICTKWPVIIIWLVYLYRESFIISFLKKLCLKDRGVLNYINHNKKQLWISIALNSLKSKVAVETHLDIFLNNFDIGCIQNDNCYIITRRKKGWVSVCTKLWLSWIGKRWLIMINPLYCVFGNEGYVAQDRNPGPEYDTLLLRLIPGDPLNACPDRQFHTVLYLLDSRAALSNSYPNALRAMQGGSLYHFMMVFGMTRPGGELTTYRACERRTRLPLNQPDTVDRKTCIPLFYRPRYDSIYDYYIT